MCKNYILILILFIAYQCVCLYSTAPIWKSSDMFRAGNNKIISTLTGNTSTPTYTFSFSSAMTGTPNIGYGMQGYEGNDALAQECFEINMTGISPTTFSVLVQIQNKTEIHTMIVSYLAVDPSFPHHLNSFDNVPANYLAGPFVNISVRQTFPTQYHNIINYTDQANSQGMTYNTFPDPSQIVITLFMTSMCTFGRNQNNAEISDGIFRPMDLKVSAAAISNEQYKISVYLGIERQIVRLHNSMIIYDKKEIQQGGNYSLVMQNVQFTDAGGFIQIPSEFTNNLIMGMTYFSTPRSKAIIDFQWEYATVSGVFGIFMPVSIPARLGITITKVGYTLLYMKTWECPSDVMPTLFNKNTNLCEECEIIGCLSCITLDQCDPAECDEPNQYFYNSTTKYCDFCSVVGCIDCQGSPDNCTQCNGTEFYSLDSATNTCERCLVNFCADCITENVCQQCNQRYFLGGGSLTCEPCPPFCLECTDYDNCLACQETAQYFLNSTTNDCQLCSLQNCLTCLSLDVCQVCDEDNHYFLNSSTNKCQLCQIQNCLECSDLDTCGVCDQASQFFTNTSNLSSCYPCSLQNCLSCSSLDICASCDEASGYFINLSNLCEPCSLQGCTQCSTLSTCNTCNQTDQYFLNVSSSLCLECPVLQCLQCSSFSTCSLCNQSNNYFLDDTLDICVPCTLNQCLQCSSLFQCQQCNTLNNYFLNLTDLQCQLCSIDNCIICQSLYSCEECDNASNYGYDYSRDNLTDAQGNQISLCGLCDVNCGCDGYGLPWTGDSCTPICGDGLIRVDEQCDDGNMNNQDGCNSNCMEQSFYECTGQPSNCTLTLSFSIQKIKAQPIQCNMFNLEVYFYPQFSVQNISASSIFFTNPQIQIKQIQSKRNGQLSVMAQYNADIHGQQLTFYIEPGIPLTFVYEPVLPAIHLSEEECSGAKDIQKLVTAITVVSYTSLLMSLLTKKINGLQLFGMLQLAYFTLAQQQFYISSIVPIKQFQIFNGLNLDIFENNDQLPVNLTEMGVNQVFLNNVNIMLILTFSILIIAALIYKIALRFANKTAIKIGLILLKQGVLTMAIFTSLNVAFSSSIHIKYSKNQKVQEKISLLLMVLSACLWMGIIFAFFFTKRKGYGQFKRAFKKVWVCEMYIIVTLLYRIAIGYYIGSNNEYEEGALLVTGFSLSFFFFHLINLPFRAVQENYRAALIHITEFVILEVTNYYRSMKSTTPMEEKARIHTPVYIQLSLICACIILSFSILVVDIYKMLKKRNLQKIHTQQTLNNESQNQVAPPNMTFY